MNYLTLGESYSRGVELLIIYTRANSRLIVIARFRPFKIQKTVSALRTIYKKNVFLNLKQIFWLYLGVAYMS